MKFKLTPALTGIALVFASSAYAEDQQEVQIKIKQVNTEEITSKLDVEIDAESGEGTKLDKVSATAAAIGNSLSVDGLQGLQYGEEESLESGDVVIKQKALDDITTKLDLEIDDVEVKNSVEATSAAIGNSASLSDMYADDLTIRQTLDDDVDARMDLEIDDTEVKGKVTATTAAIGNSLTFSDVGLDDDLEIIQRMDDDATARADIDLDDVDVKKSLDATTAAIGNSLSIDGLNDAEIDDNIDIKQVTTGDASAKMDVEFEEVDVNKATSLTAAAIGNSASISNIADIDDEVDISQKMKGDVEAKLDVEMEDVDMKGGLDLTAAAIGNSLSISDIAEIDNDDLDINQVMTGESKAKFELEISADEENDSDIRAALSATAAAIGNSVSIDDINDIDHDDLEISQTALDDVKTDMEIELDDLEVQGQINVTAAAIGNSATVTDVDIDRDDLYADQRMTDDVVSDLELDLDEVEAHKAMTATSAAIGNSLSLDDVQVNERTQISQKMKDDATASMELELEDSSVEKAISLTTAAIGNSASFTDVDFEGDVDEDELAVDLDQLMDGDVTGSLDVEIEDTEIGGAVDMTVAAIGNSLSLSDSDTAPIDLDQTKIDGDVTSTAEVELDDLDLGDVSITAAAIGNSASLSDNDSMDLTSNQFVEDTNVYASLDLNTDEDWEDLSVSSEKLNVTVAAIGNSLSAETYDGKALNIRQEVLWDDDDVEAGIQAVANVNSDDMGKIDMTVAAIGNSAAFEGLGGGVGNNVNIYQNNTASVLAVANLNAPSPTSVNATAAAIGNSLSISITHDDD